MKQRREGGMEEERGREGGKEGGRQRGGENNDRLVTLIGVDGLCCIIYPSSGMDNCGFIKNIHSLVGSTWV